MGSAPCQVIRPSFVKTKIDDSSQSNSNDQNCNVPSKNDTFHIPTTLSSNVPDVVKLISFDSNQNKRLTANTFNRKSFESFCRVFCHQLLSEDILNNDSFIDAMACNSKPLIAYSQQYTAYKSTHTRERANTVLYKVVTEINNMLDLLKITMKETSDIKIMASKGLHNMIVSAKVKEARLKKVLTETIKIKEEISRTNILYKLKKRFNQTTSSTKDTLRKVVKHNDVTFKCMNTNLSWEDAYLNAECNILPGQNFTSLDILSVASDIQAEFCLATGRLHENHRKELIDTLVEFFSVIFASRSDKSVLLDIQELLLDKDLFSMLLGENDEDNGETDNIESKINQNKAKSFIGPLNRQGRTPMYIKYPELVECASNFIKEHSFAAHVRRRESTATGAGVTLNDIRKHLLEVVPGLKQDGGISRDTIHRLTVAPRKNSTRAQRYKGLIDARVPGKQNQYREESLNQHFLFARVAYREEFTSMFCKEAQFYSCDDMNKLRMGPATAVSRCHQIYRFFMSNDAPNVGDHDFPNPGYLLVPSGYMSLSSRTYHEEIDEEYTNHEMNDFVQQTSASTK